MAAITPTVQFSDLTHLILQNFLIQTTGITDWQNFDSALAPPDDGSFAFAGVIWPQSYDPTFKVTSKVYNSSSRWGIRLLIANADVDDLSLAATQWSRVLSELLAATTSTAEMAKLGVDLSGTYAGFTVLAGTTLGLTLGGPWQIVVEENESGGGVARISNTLLINNAR